MLGRRAPAGRGRPTYLVEYGEVSFRDGDHDLGPERWAEDVVPGAIREVSRHAGGRPVHVVGWSLGGIFAMLAAADGPGLPIASLSVLGSPVDTTLVPLVAPLRPLLAATDWPGPVARTYRALGVVSRPLVRWAGQLTSVENLVTKPLAVAVHLDDAEWLAQVEAVDRFMGAMTAYPGRSFGQLYHRFAKGNALATGTIEVGDHDVSLSAVTAPTLVFAGAGDGIAPVAAVRAVVPLLSGSPDVRFEIVPGGHLGLLTGRGARDTTWQVLDEWLAQWRRRRRTGEACDEEGARQEGVGRAGRGRAGRGRAGRDRAGRARRRPAPSTPVGGVTRAGTVGSGALPELLWPCRA